MRRKLKSFVSAPASSQTWTFMLELVFHSRNSFVLIQLPYFLDPTLILEPLKIFLSSIYHETGKRLKERHRAQRCTVVRVTVVDSWSHHVFHIETPHSIM